MSTSLLLSMAISLLLTIVIELIVGMILGARNCQLIIILAVNLLTNPTVNVIYHILCYYTDIHSVIITAALEISAVTVEWHIYRQNGVERSFRLSLILNASSYFIGVLLNIMF